LRGYFAKKVARELLRGCGMIWRSEKRWLVGGEAGGIGGLVSKAAGLEDPATAFSFAGFLATVLVTYHPTVYEKSVLPLLNPF